eukprot:7073312-Prymnesium_polylepis.2
MAREQRTQRKTPSCSGSRHAQNLPPADLADHGLPRSLRICQVPPGRCRVRRRGLGKGMQRPKLVKRAVPIPPIVGSSVEMLLFAAPPGCVV